MEKVKYRFKNKIAYKNKDKDFFNRNPLNLMNKTFSNPKTKLSDFQKGKEFKKNINEQQQQHSSKAFYRIWSSQNILYGNNNWDYIKKPIRNNLYSSSSIIFRAPSVKENRYEISRMMRKEKYKKMNYLNNIYNTLMISESKLYRKRLYLTGFKANSTKGKVELKKRYNMDDMNSLNNNEKNININLRLGIKSSFVKNRGKKNINGYESSLIRYKYLKKKLEENEKFEIKNKFNNKNNKHSDIPTSSTYKTNYNSKYSKLISAKKLLSDNSKSNDMNIKSFSISNTSTAKLRKTANKENNNFEINEKRPSSKKESVFLYQYKD